MGTTNRAEELETLSQYFADIYVKQFLPHVDTTGHWLGFIDAFKQRQSEIDELKSKQESSEKIFKEVIKDLQDELKTYRK